MPKVTYPNQRNIKINRERATVDFLGIKNENWQAASRDLGATALRLYLYLASNANGYTIALSPAAVRRDIGMARSTYHDQFHILVDKGYLVPAAGNTFEFFEKPQPRTVSNSKNEVLTDGLNFETSTAVDEDIPQNGQGVMRENTEINNTTDITNNGINIGQVEAIYQPKVTEIKIPSPSAQGNKRPTYIPPKNGEFVF